MSWVNIFLTSLYKFIGFRAGSQKLGYFNLMKYLGFIDVNQTVHTVNTLL